MDGMKGWKDHRRVSVGKQALQIAHAVHAMLVR